MGTLQAVGRSKSKYKPRRARRPGPLAVSEQNLIDEVVRDQHGEVRPAQIKGLAMALGHKEKTIKAKVEEAREKFAKAAGRYVDIHMSATEAALADGDNEQALKGSQWALEHVGFDGARVVDKATAVQPSGTKIMIGVKLGGAKDPVAVGVTHE